MGSAGIELGGCLTCCPLTTLYLLPSKEGAGEGKATVTAETGWREGGIREV